MEVKLSYKQPAVEVLPQNWAVQPLFKLTSEIGDGIHTTPEYSGPSGYYFINGNNLKDGAIKTTDNTMCVSETEWLKHRKNLSSRTILISINGTIGNLAFYGHETVVLGKSAAYMNVTPVVSKEYIFYALSTSAIAKHFEDELTGTTIKNLSLAALRNTSVIMPNILEEQKAIAAALSDMDALLTAQDKLIAKKHNIKHAAMQELLTGKRRLPGFSGTWKAQSLRNLADFFKGRGLSKSVVSPLGDKKCILYGELFTTYGCVISNVKSSTLSQDGLLSQRGDILIPGSTTTVGADLAIASALLEENVLLGGDIIVVRGKPKRFDPVFMANYLTYAKRQEIAERTQGITIIHLYSKDLADLPTTLPDLNEQVAIAAVLSDMDAEIVALKQKQEKTRALKQGMMQELLTGRTRLV